MITKSSRTTRSTCRKLRLEWLHERAMFAADFVEPGLMAGDADVEVAAERLTSRPLTICEQQPAGALTGYTRQSTNSQDQVSAHPYDVNNDGVVSAIDVQQIVDYLNAKESNIVNGEESANPRLDVSGDGAISPLDALQIINHLKAGSHVNSAAPEASSVQTSETLHNSLDVDRSGSVDPNDLELVFEHIEESGSTAIAAVTEHVDTNRDGHVSPADALAVINSLERGALSHRDFIAATDRLFAVHDEVDDLTDSLFAGLIEETWLHRSQRATRS